MNAEEIFDELKRTSAYTQTAPEEIKRKILVDVWNESAERLRTRFGPDGTHEKHGIGFGYLVEEFAKRSPRIPRNTAAGEKLAGIILGALRSGGNAFIPLAKPQYNPDLVWISLRGRKAEISGIGEVKASLRAFRDKHVQAAYQEDSVRLALELIERDRANGAAHEYFVMRKVTARDPFRKTMIVPFGLKAEFLPYLLQGWTCEEIEFSPDELIFVAQKLWPEFRAKITFTENVLAHYEKEFLPRLWQWGGRLIAHLYQDASIVNLPAKELLIFSLIHRKLPVTELDVIAIGYAVCKALPLLLRYPDKMISSVDLTEWEQQFFCTFSLLLEGEGIPKKQAREEILLFLTNLRLIAAEIRWKRPARAKSRFQEFDLLAYLV